ncbi:MAG: hypothetical protein ACTSRK_03835 [Promethearchaeota archaeon]
MPEKLHSFLERIPIKFSRQWYGIRDLQEWMMDEIYRKRKTYPHWRKKVLFGYVSWQRKMRHRKHGDRKAENLHRFLYSKLDWLFKFYFENMFLGFNVKQLHLISKEGDYQKNSDLFFLYQYDLREAEIEEFRWFKQEYQHPDHYYRIISYIFNLIVMVFSRLITDILKKDISIKLISADIKESAPNQKSLQFLIAVRKPETEFLKSFLNSLIYDFAELLPGIDFGLLKNLLNRKEKLYPMALEAYPKSKVQLTRVLYTLQRKSQVLGNINPLLDILNFIAARVEDSIFDTDELLHDILVDTLGPTSDASLIPIYEEIFTYLNASASLFSTFQSNNRAIIHRQYQLFFFYCLYFLPSDLFISKQNLGLFFPATFYETLSQRFNKKLNIEQSFQILNFFLLQGIQYGADKALDVVFSKIFKQSIHHLNESFFAALLKSINTKLNLLIRENLPENLSFDQFYDEMIHVMCTIMHNLAKKIFIRDHPEDAMGNFRDNLTRYTPKRIALRVLELRIFKDIPLADNNWQDYYLSRNKNTVKRNLSKYYDIPDNYFFTEERLLKINMNYERGILEETPLLEEWLIDNIMQPFNEFYSIIHKKIRKKPDYDRIRAEIYLFFSQGIIEHSVLEKIEDYADHFAQLWQML